MPDNKSDVLQGTLDLIILKTLNPWARCMATASRAALSGSRDTLSLNQGTLYPALLRLEQRKWIKSEWGTSDTGRRARFYGLTARGRKQVAAEEENWSRIVSTMARFLTPTS